MEHNPSPPSPGSTLDRNTLRRKAPSALLTREDLRELTQSRARLFFATPLVLLWGILVFNYLGILPESDAIGMKSVTLGFVTVTALCATIFFAISLLPNRSISLLRTMMTILWLPAFAMFLSFRLSALQVANETALTNLELGQWLALASSSTSNLHLVFFLILGILMPVPLSYRVKAALSTVIVSLLVTGASWWWFPALTAVMPVIFGATSVFLALAAGVVLVGAYKTDALERELADVKREIQEVGNYRLTRKLGGGGMGEVYLAEHRLLKRPCAVKVIREQRAGDPEYSARFFREVQATSRLQHPNTVEIYDYGRTEDGTMFYVMEYLDGWTLGRLVADHGPLPAGRVVYLLAQIAGALREAHEVGLIHRDIKPDNIMVSVRGGVFDFAKLLDFGLVRADRSIDTTTQLTNLGAILGTPGFMSPEQAEGLEVDARGDLYSLGGVAYFLLTGQPPFLRETPMQTMMAHVRDPLPSIHERSPNVPADLVRVVEQLLAKCVNERIQTAEELRYALLQLPCAAEWDVEQAAEWWRTHRPEKPKSETRKTPVVELPRTPDPEATVAGIRP